MRSNAAVKLPLIRFALNFRRAVLFSFVAILNSYEQTAVLNVCCDTDPIVAREVARKCENLSLNSLRDVLSWRHKQY